MRSAGAPAANGRNAESLRAVLEDVLAPHLGTATRVASVASAPSRFAHRATAEILTVELERGGTLRLFRKELGREHGDHPDKARRDREPMVYRELLSRAYLDTPRFYGSRWDARTGRHDLFLEYVDAWSLKYHDLDQWATAVRRLAALHAAFARQGGALARHDFLLRLDGSYLGAWAARAVATAGEASAALGRRLERVVADHRQIAELLTSQPLTLVHNDLAPKNAIADVSSSPTRICFVDWEMAGVGCGLLDLAHLMHGLSPRDEERLRAAYCSELGGAGLLPSGRRLRRVLDACALHNAVYRVAHAQEWGIQPRTVARWVDEIADLRKAI
jgi:Phosphotransferase enzyme family